MANKGFDITGFRGSPSVPREFFPKDGLKEGEGVQLNLNLDLLSLEKMEALENEFDDIFKESAGITKLPKGPKSKSGKLVVAGTKPEPLPKLELFAFEKALFRFFVTALAGRPGENDPFDRLIHSWNVERDGKAVPISFESFSDMPPHGLRKLYQFCIGAANNPTPQEKKA